MVDRLVAEGCVRGVSVDRVLRSVPRHLFVPMVEPDSAYSDLPVVLRYGAAGRPVSLSGPPSMTAAVLELSAVAAGDRVLEVGAGSGYDAALLAELTGPSGQVTTVEIDPVVAWEAGERLAAAGYGRVVVLTGDGWDGAVARAPFDRVVCTVGVWDVSPAWLGQLEPFGVLVAPLWLRAGLQVAVALRWDLDRLTSDVVLPCAFGRLRGRGAGPEAYQQVAGRSVCLDESDPRVVKVLAEVLARPARVVPLGRAPDPCWFTGLALAAPDAVQMAWVEPGAGAVSAVGVFDPYRRGLALVVTGLGGPEVHAHGDGAAAERLRGLLAAVRPVRMSDLVVDVVPAGSSAVSGPGLVAVLRRPGVSVVVRRRVGVGDGRAGF